MAEQRAYTTSAVEICEMHFPSCEMETGPSRRAGSYTNEVCLHLQGWAWLRRETRGNLHDFRSDYVVLSISHSCGLLKWAEAHYQDQQTEWQVMGSPASLQDAECLCDDGAESSCSV